jgi:processive 1,2-diacylglycerol beta-glucosyltransferase
MTSDLKILIFYASYGEGHIQVSKALINSFKEKGIKHIKMIDLLAEAHPKLDALSRFFYLKSTSYWPQLYGWSYYRTYNMQHDQLIGKWLNSLCIPKLEAIIQREKPDAVINTFPMLSMSELRKKIGLFIPTFTVLTDYILHSRWLHPGTDKYFVATEDLKKTMIQKGIKSEQITVSGIPVRKVFQQHFDLKVIAKKYDLDPQKKNVLIMANAYSGMSNLKKMISALLLEDVQILFVCGNDKGLRTKLETLFEHEAKVKIMGFVDQIQELMAISSCIITKAGGITLTEAIVLQLPILVFRPLPGQELENALYLAEKKLLFITNKIIEIKKIVHQLISNHEQRSQMKLAMGAMHKKAASEFVVSEILTEINQRSSLKHKNELPAGGKLYES